MAVPKKKRYSCPRQVGTSLVQKKTKQSSLTYFFNKQRPYIKNLLNENSIYNRIIKNFYLRNV